MYQLGAHRKELTFSGSAKTYLIKKKKKGMDFCHVVASSSIWPKLRTVPVIIIKQLLSLDIIKAGQNRKGGVNPWRQRRLGWGGHVVGTR